MTPPRNGAPATAAGAGTHKFADLDNDTWQDLFIVQGTRLRLYNPSNVFYRNKGGTALEDSTRAAGLEDHLPTASFLFLDYNLDGALDLITFRSN